LLAGAFSMGAGEYVSVRSQREMYEYQIALERAELAEYPEEEAEELAMILVARGMDEEEAKRYSSALVKDPARALETLAREELGLDPRDLGSPWAAAFSSFFSFAFGAAVPLAPFLFSAHRMRCLDRSRSPPRRSLPWAQRSACSRDARRSPAARACWRSAPAQGALTYLLGRLLGVSLG
jgi:hypothetical protein